MNTTDKTKQDEFKKFVDQNGHVITCVYADDPTDPRSYRNQFNSWGRFTGCVYGEDPKQNESFEWVFDPLTGKRLAAIFACDPADPRSWVKEWDSNRTCIGCIYGMDYKNPNSWRDDLEQQKIQP